MHYCSFMWLKNQSSRSMKITLVSKCIILKLYVGFPLLFRFCFESRITCLCFTANFGSHFTAYDKWKSMNQKKDLTFEGWIWVIFSHLAWPCPLIFFPLISFPKNCFCVHMRYWRELSMDLNHWGSCHEWSHWYFKLKDHPVHCSSLASNWSHVGIDSAYIDSDLIGTAGQWDFVKLPRWVSYTGKFENHYPVQCSPN